MSRFTIVSGPRAGEAFDVGERRCVVGRDEDCDVVIDDDRVSRKHAALVERDGGTVVVDLGSSNGTFVNDEIVTERELEEGDMILVGHTTMRCGEAKEKAAGPGADPRPVDASGQKPPNGRTLVDGADPLVESETIVLDLPGSGQAPRGGAAAPPRERRFPADPAEMPRIGDFLRGFARGERLGEPLARRLGLAVREVAANAILRAFADAPGEIRVACRREGDRVLAEIAHRGAPFNPAAEPDPLGEDEQTEPSFFAHSLMDRVEYRREGDLNISVLSAKIE